MDGPVRGILGAGVILAAVVFASLGLLQWIFNVFERRAEEAAEPRHALAEEVVVPPEPRLLGARQHHPDRLDLIDRGIGGIAPA
jgi:hypothetical protein